MIWFSCCVLQDCNTVSRTLKLSTVKRIARNLFRRGRRFVYRRRRNGKEVWRTLTAGNEAQARREVQRLTGALWLNSNSAVRTVGDALEYYRAAGFPTCRGKERPGLGWAERAVASLATIVAPASLYAFSATVWREYTKQATGRGAAALDREFRLIRAALAYCSRFPDETGVTDCPRLGWWRPLYDSTQARHCRDRQPEHADEINDICHALFDAGQDVVAWFVVVQAMTGARCSELLRLRMTRERHQPGFDDGRNLWLPRSRTAKGTAPFAVIHADLRRALTCFYDWHDQTFPQSGWWFPAARSYGLQPIKANTIQKALRRVSDRVTSHGLRSYFVNVLRSQEMTDAEIALRIGHKSGGRLIVDVYGSFLARPISYRPLDRPAAWFRSSPGSILRVSFGE